MMKMEILNQYERKTKDGESASISIPFRFFRLLRMLL